MEYQHGATAMREVVPDEDRGAYGSEYYDGNDCLIACQACGKQFVETFETDACPGCGTGEE